MSTPENPQKPPEPVYGNLAKFRAPVVEQRSIKRHILRCFLAGLVAVLPVGGLVILIVLLDSNLRVVVRGSPFSGLDFPGVGLLAGFIGIYILGLTLTTFIGRFFWGVMDTALSGIPGVGPIFKTFKQVLGYGQGDGALFQQVVLVPSGGEPGKGPYELGLVTGEVQVDGKTRLAIFVPSSPNPTQGRFVVAEPGEYQPTKIPVDAALKALFSTGKTGL